MSIQANFPAIAPSLLLDFANTKQLDNRITFTRSTPAVYYDGKTTAMAEQNLTLQSQTFNVSPWAVSNTTVTANATTAPDGTNTADKIVEDTADSAHAIYQLIGTTSGSCTFSVYAKADTRSWLNINTYVAGVRNNWFDLTNGVVGTIASGCTASITSVGNGWYRCSVTTTGGSPTYFELWLATGNNVTNYAGNGTSGLFVWGAQIEARSTATAYTVTSTQAITNYIPVLLTAGGNQPRFDCNPTTGESLGLLIEEQRTNLATYSEDFSYYTGSGSITVNQGIAPNGTQTADLITGTSDIYQTLVGSSSGTYSLSMYVRSITAPYFMLSFGYPSVQRVVFNLSNGSVSSTVGTNITGSSISVGNNWYRLTIVGISQGSILYNQFNSYASTTYNDKTTGALIWGAQLEAGAFATSYIATTSASATRTADAASMTGVNFTSWFNNSEGTLYGEGGGKKEQGALATINTANAYQNMIVLGTITPAVAFRMWANGSPEVDLGSVNAGTQNRLSFGYATNNSAVSINGATVLTDSNCIVPNLSSFSFFIGTGWDVNHNLCGTIKKLAYYPIRVTNTQLQALTS